MHGTILLIPIAGMIALELQHLKWIWLEYWSCRACGRKNLECGCKPAWVKYL